MMNTFSKFQLDILVAEILQNVKVLHENETTTWLQQFFDLFFENSQAKKADIFRGMQVINPSQMTILRLFQTQSLQTTILNLKKIRVEKTGKKENLLVTSNFFFSHSVFKTCTADMLKTRACFGKG